jgi:hypothetical protein
LVFIFAAEESERSGNDGGATQEEEQTGKPNQIFVIFFHNRDCGTMNLFGKEQVYQKQSFSQESPFN